MNTLSPKILEKLIGRAERFPLHQQLFHSITFCGALIALMMSISDFMLKLGVPYYLFSFSMAASLAVLHISSRKGHPFQFLTTLYFFIIGIIMLYVWLMLDGFGGSLLLITLALSITIPMTSKGVMSRCAFTGQMLLLGTLFLLEHLHPKWIGSRPPESALYADQFCTTLILCMGSYLGISFLMQNNHNQKKKLHDLNQEMSTSNDQLRQRTGDLEKALEQIHELNQLLPICSSCRKIRHDDGYWIQIEQYFSIHGNASFTHGICPDCGQELYGEFYDPGEIEKERLRSGYPRKQTAENSCKSPAASGNISFHDYIP